MPFGESFQSTIKSNKSIMLDKTRRFRKTSGSFDWSKSQQFNFVKATPEELKLIKEKIQLFGEIGNCNILLFIATYL